MPNPPTVFISYRRELSVDLAQRIHDYLTRQGVKVFLDLDALEGGERWKARLQREVVNCDYVLAVLAPHTLESEWVRYEIKIALDQNKTIIPVTHHGFVFTHDAIPEEISDLSEFNAIPFIDRYPNAAFEEIKHSLGITDTGTSSPTPAVGTAFLPSAAPEPPTRIGIPKPGFGCRGVSITVTVTVLGLLFAFLALFPEQTRTDWLHSLGLLPSTATQAVIAPSNTPPPTDAPTITSLPPTPTPTPTDNPSATPTLLITNSPISGRIVFISNRDGSEEIYVMNADGSNLVRLTANGTDDFTPNWSPDGRQIAYASEVNGNVEIYIMNADGSNPRNITNSPNDDYSPAWSPDGQRIAFHTFRDGNSEIYVMNADGSNPVRLTTNSRNNASPVWSPDGKQIAFDSQQDGDTYLGEIYLMNADGTNPVRLTTTVGNDDAPAWSPDGKQIAFVSYRDGHHEIYVMNADGSNPRNLTNSFNGDLSPSWSPDGAYIFFTSNRDNNYEIYVMNADGSNPRNLTNNPAYDAAPNLAIISLPFTPVSPTATNTAVPPTSIIVTATPMPTNLPPTATTATKTYPCDATIVFTTGALINQVRVTPQQKAPTKYPVQQGANISVFAKQRNDGLDWYQIAYEDNNGWIPSEYVILSDTCPTT